jgi:hypothetical protein
MMLLKARRLEAQGMSVVSSSLLLVTTLLLPSIAPAQSRQPPTSSSTVQQSPAATVPDPDLLVNPSEPDFTLSALPTTLRMPSGKFAFRLTHRFSRPIASGDVSDFFADLFGFDSSAQIGLELRYGVRPGTQVAFHRTNDRAIQFLGQHELLDQKAGRLFTVDALVSVEGADNFSEDFSTTVGAVVSRQFTQHGGIYVQPLFVFNTNPVDDGDEHTMLLGFGGRFRLGSSRTYVVAEAAPVISGHDAGIDHVSFGIEHRVGGHMFQFTVANALGTTMRQIALGGPHEDDWFVGFNLSRRFF